MKMTKNGYTVIILLIGLSVLLLTQLQYIFGLLNTPKDHVYLGTVHYPPDYFNYLSWIIQGEEHLLSSTLLYTGEDIGYNLSRWQFVLAGRFFSTLGIGVIETYQIMVVLGRIAFLAAGYLLISKIFPNSYSKRLLAFLFFASSTGWPIVSFNQQGIHLGYHWYWFNTGNFYARFGNTPHHLLSNTILAVGLATVINLFNKSAEFSYQRARYQHFRLSEQYFQLRRLRLRLISFALIGLFLGSTNPVEWGLMVGSLLLANLIMSLLTSGNFLQNMPKLNSKLQILPRSPHCGLRGTSSKQYQMTKIQNSKRLVFGIFNLEFVWNLVLGAWNFNILPLVFLTLGGLPAVLYLKRLYSIEPFSYVRVWEASQQLNISPQVLFYGSGLVIILVAVGIVPFLKRINPARIVAASFIFLSALFLFTPLPAKLGTTNARFWPGVNYVILGSFASQGVFFLSTIWSRGRRAILAIILIFYLTTTATSQAAQLQELIKPQYGNMFYYLPTDAYGAYEYIKKNTGKDNLFLSQWVFNESLPALTGRKVFYGDRVSHMTLNAAEKTVLASDFLGGRMTEAKAEKFLLQNKIDYVLASPTSYFNSYPFLKKIYSAETVSLYKVEK